MANNVKEYKLVINGITESIDAVKSLNEQLSKLEARIKALEGKSVGVKASSTSTGGGSKSSSTGSLSEEEKLAKQIEQIDAKRVAYSKEIYQNYLAAKDVLNETVNDQKSIAASERLQAKSYSNTIQGMKQELADIKSAMQTVDLGDSDQLDKMVQRANELNEALKKIEESYGQFGRNVGNYSSAFSGMTNVKVEVGALTREFGSMREAVKTLKAELYALENSEKGNTQQAKNLRKAINELDSAIKDATVSSRAMDTAMDFMQSFTAMASIGSGLQAFFGFDDNEITKSIQKIVALQGVLKGLEEIRKQMDTKEGIGKILGRGFEKIDTWTYSLRKLNVQLRGTGTTAKIAAAGIKFLNYALKGLMTAGILIGIDLLVEGLQKLVAYVRDWAKGDADLVSAADVLKQSIEAQNLVLEKNIELIKKANDSGIITDTQAKALYELEYAKALKETNKALKEREGLIREQGINGNSELYLQSAIGDKGTTSIGGFSEAINSIKDFEARWDYLNKRVIEGKDLWDSFWGGLFSSVDDAKDEFNHLNKIVANDFINAFYKMADGTMEGSKALVDYIRHMDELTNGKYSQAMKLVKVDNESLQNELDNAWAMIENLRDKVWKNPIVVRLELNAKIEQELDRLDPTRQMQRSIDEWTQMLVFGIDDAGNKLSETQKKNIEKIIAGQKKNLEKQKKQRLDAEKNSGKKLAEEQERVDREIRRLRIENMKEGLEKELAQLREERRIKLEEAKKTGIRVGELQAEIREYYNKKEIEAVRKHNAEVAALNKEMWEEFYRTYDNAFRMNADSQLTELETRLEKAIERLTKEGEDGLRILSSRYASYGGVQLDNRMSDDLRKGLGHDTKVKKTTDVEGENIKKAKEYLDILEKLEETRIATNYFGDNVNEVRKASDEAEKELNEWLEKNEEFINDERNQTLIRKMADDGYTKSIATAYKIRIRQASLYYEEVENLEKNHSEKVMNNELALLTKEWDTEKREETNRYEDQIARLEENKEKGLLTEANYNELAEQALVQHKNALDAIEKRFNAENERIEQDHQNRKKQIVADGLRGMLNEYRDAYDAISKIQSRQPQMMSGALGDMGIINFGLTKQKYTEALDAYKELSKNIIQEKEDLQTRLNNNEISFDDFQQAKRELDGLEQDCADSAMEIQENLKKLGGEWWASINQWIQQVGQTANQIIGAIFEIQEAALEKEKEELERQNDVLKEKLDEQEQMIEEHKSAVDSIEDELASARGDRRQHLIDQLNAEMAAERAAQKEKQRIQKEQEKNQKKQDTLEKKRKMAQWKSNLLQAIVNGAMAISMAAINAWPVPAIPMMALAAATTAAQIAVISANKPYAKGGVLEGPSHKQGGIPVGNTGIEVEGKEYVIRKKSTTPNVELLDMINRSERKLNLDDFIDFYTSGKIKKNISSMSPRTRFAEGGTIPTITNDYAFDDRLLTAFEDYSNRPVYVSVVDINNRQDAVKNVQVLAGIE